MKYTGSSVRICAVILAAALIWRIVGAPIRPEDFQNLKTAAWQAKILMPQRTVRMLGLWMIFSTPEHAQTMRPGDPEASEQQLTVYVNQENKLVQMPLEAYVCGVVAAEMPARYHLEALKAQAVAARTRAMGQMLQGGCSLHSGADICTDSGHCQGYATQQECLRRWEDGYEAYRGRIVMAQQETAGQWISYEDNPITVLYHANSGGRTESAQTAFSQSIPYLVSVESAEDPMAEGYQQEAFFAFGELAAKLDCSVEDVQRTLAIGGYTPSGRVSHVQIAGREMKATELRRALDLRSTMFSITADEKGITFHQRGYGHGVGMSQTGANQMAAEGAGYIQILQHYYPGVEIVFPE